MTAPQRTSLFASLFPFIFGLSALGQGFATAPVLPLAGDPQLLVTADFNGDGQPDLAYLDALNGGSLHILLGNGDGSFRTSQVIAIPANITGQIDAADLNADGVPDLVLGGAGVTTLLGRGDGNFGSPVTSTNTAGSAAGHAAFADFDGDGKLDIFLTSPGSSVVLKGDGKGAFSVMLLESGNSFSGPDAFAADLNGDGRPDLLSANGTFGFSVALNLGGGSFASPVSYSTPETNTGTRYLALIDVNGDGHPDVLFPGLYDNPGQLIASLGRADGTFAPAAVFASTGLHSFRLVGSADLHGDGKSRIFLAGTEGFGTVLGNSPAGSPMFEGSSIRPEQTVLADFNGDGVMDMATPDDHSLVVLLGRSDGTFTSTAAQQIGSTIGAIQVADVNGDHIPDLLLGADLIFAGVGDGTFASAPLQTPSGYGTGNYSGGSTFPFYPANFNGDGKVDLLSLPEMFLLGNGNGTFTQASAPRVMGTPFYYGAVADFDGDGLDDGVEIGRSGGAPPLGGVNIFMSRAQAFTSFTLPNSEAAGPVVTGDFDGDGCQDLAVAGLTHVVLYKGDCHGNLTYTSSYSFNLPASSASSGVSDTSMPGDIALADVDGDGRRDLIITLPALSEAQVLYSNGDGTFTPGTPFVLSRTALYVSAADIDGDGRADLVFSGIGDPIVLYGTPDRTFGPERVFAAGFQTGKAVLADLRSTGKQDLVLPNLNTYSELLFNTLGYTYTRFLNAAPAAGTSAVAVNVDLPGNSVVYGSAAAATVRVNASNSVAVPGGYVSLQIDGAPFASAALDTSGKASLPLNAIDVGSHVVQVVYLGGTNFRTGIGTASLLVSPAPTSLSVVAAPAPSTTLQGLTLTAVVTSASTVASGQVTFNDNDNVLGSAPLDRTGTATLSVPAFAAGTHQISATFVATQDFLGSQSSLSQQVNAVASGTAVTVTPASSHFGSDILISVAVSAGATSLLPSGAVTCTDGAVMLGTATLASGSASITTSALPAGPSNIVCSYAGDAIFAPSTSASAAIDVMVRYGSTISLAVTAAGAPVTSVAAGTTILLSAQVNSNAAPVSQGQVVFCDGTSSNCTDIHQVGLAQLTSTGMATLAVTPGPGTHSYTARFLGLPSAQPTQSGTSTLAVTGGVLSTAALAAVGSPGSYSLTAQLTGTGPIPTGLVKFLDTSNANAVLGTASLAAATGSTPFSSTSIATPARTSGVSSTDLNGDGHSDLAVATGPNGGILILLGNGDGTFTPGQTLVSSSAVNANAFALVFGDFNGDGHPDLATLNNDDKTLSIFFGVGDGTLNTTPVRTDTSAYDLFTLAVVDINGDGKADLVGAAEGNDEAVFLLGNGDGTFQNATTQSVSKSPRKVVVGDFNQDGIPDLVLTTGGQGSLSVLLGNGDGTFRAMAAPAISGVPISAVAADLNGDGHLDLAITDDANASVRILLGNGDGTFQVLSTSYPTGAAPIDIIAGDFDGDGRVDLAVASELGNAVTLLQGKGDGTFTTSTVPTGIQPEYLAAADLNGDGRTDLLVGNVGESDVTQLIAQGSTTTTATLANLAPLGPGTHLVQASYGGDTNYSPRLTNVVSLVAQSATTTLGLVASPTQSTYGQTLTLTATLNPSTVGVSTSDGDSVTFLNGNAVVGACTLKSGTCSFDIAALNVGSYLFSAQYKGDPALGASVSAALPVTVQPGAASITFNVANHTFGDAPFSVIATSLTGGPFSFSVVSGPATVVDSLVTLTGAGTVVLRVDQPASGNYAASSQTATFTVAPASQTIHLTAPSKAVYGSSIAVMAQATSGLPVALSVVSGPATLSGNLLSFTAAGTVVIAADQAGNTDYSPATQVRQTIQVNPFSASLTWSPPAMLTYGATLQDVLNATANAGTSAVPGTFAYTIGGAVVSSATVLNAGTYTVQLAFTPMDTTRYGAASATANLTVDKAASGIALTTAAPAVFSGNPVVMTATVSSVAGTPTGTVIFLNGSTVLGTANLNAGVAQLSFSSLPVGTQTLTATFSGGPNFRGGTSAPVAETVQDLTLTTPSQAPIVTATGAVATTTFTLNANGQTFPQAVNFSASGLPPGATATFSPASLPAGSTATSVTVTFNLPKTTASVFRQNDSSGVAMAMLLLIFPASGLRARKRLRSLVRKRQSFLLGTILALSFFGITGCGGNSNASSQPGTTPAKSYNVTLTASSGALQRSTTITLQVR